MWKQWAKDFHPCRMSPGKTTAAFLAQVPGAINRGLRRFINYTFILGLLQYEQRVHFVPISPHLSVTWIGLCLCKNFLQEKEAAYPGRPLPACVSHPSAPKRPLPWEFSLCWHCSCSWAKQENLVSSGCWANQTFFWILLSANWQLPGKPARWNTSVGFHHLQAWHLEVQLSISASTNRSQHDLTGLWSPANSTRFQQASSGCRALWAVYKGILGSLHWRA